MAMQKKQNQKKRPNVKSKGGQQQRATEAASLPQSVICGRNPVLEALKKNQSLNKVLLAAGQEAHFIKQIKELCKEKKVPCQEVERQRLDQIIADHRGVIAYAAPYQYVELEDILAVAKARDEAPLVVMLAEVEDPHNLGAILRTAECAGVHGVVIAKHGAVPMTETVVKVAAGAAEYMQVARVANLSQALDYFKEQGLWVAGADMEGESLWQANLTGDLVIVLGNEGKGIPRLVAEHCDFMVKIPMFGEINSLNVSASAAVLIYEAVRQRTAAEE